jgi:hypothetical protein
MRTLRQFHSRIQGRIQAVSLGNAPAVMISAIFGAYLSLQLVARGAMFG